MRSRLKKQSIHSLYIKSWNKPPDAIQLSFTFSSNPVGIPGSRFREQIYNHLQRTYIKSKMFCLWESLGEVQASNQNNCFEHKVARHNQDTVKAYNIRCDTTSEQRNRKAYTNSIQFLLLVDSLAHKLIKKK
jgi:hypothetical protein